MKSNLKPSMSLSESSLVMTKLFSVKWTFVQTVQSYYMPFSGVK